MIIYPRDGGQIWEWSGRTCWIDRMMSKSRRGCLVAWTHVTILMRVNF